MSQNCDIYKYDPSGTLYSVLLDVPHRKREQSGWCWAACAEMIGKYLDKSSQVTQTQIVINVKGSAINEGATDAETAQALRYVCDDSRVVKYDDIPFDETECIEKLQDGKPFICHLLVGYNDHAVLCYGYEMTAENGLILFFNDPNESGNTFSLERRVLYNGFDYYDKKPYGSDRCIARIWID